MAFRPTPAGYGRSVALWFHNLEVYNKDLADRVLAQVGTVTEGELGPGHARILLSELDEATRNELLAELPFLAKMKAPNALRDNEKMSEITLSDAVKQAKVENDGKAGLARLTEWGTTGLLEDTENNAEQIKNWLETKTKGYLSVANIDAAVQILRGEGKLTFRKPAPPPVEAPPVETLATLSDGSKQLKLGTVPNRSHTITQLRDLDQRERVARGKQQGHFATRF